MGAPRPHCPDVSDLVQPQGDLEGGHVELGVVGQYADRGPRIDGAEFLLGVQIAVGPVDDHLVGRRKTGRRRKDRAGIAHRHAVAEEGGLLGQGGREVDGAEDQHACRRGVTRDEDRHAGVGIARGLVHPFAVGPVGQHRGAAGQQQPAGVVGHRGIGAPGTQRPGHGVRLDDEVSAQPGVVGMRDHRGHRHRAMVGDGRGDVGELRERLLRHRFDEHVENAAAGQADGKSVIVAEAVAL